ncbi:hypothetical protein ACMFMF_000729 [Clarireedia jacksonii]
MGFLPPHLFTFPPSILVPRNPHDAKIHRSNHCSRNILRHCPSHVLHYMEKIFMLACCRRRDRDGDARLVREIMKMCKWWLGDDNRFVASELVDESNTTVLQNEKDKPETEMKRVVDY